MQAPAQPSNEALRIETLREFLILDTPPEERFDNLTRAAASFFRVQIAVVSLVDVNRQWFKSICGLDASETPRDVSFCGHAILQNEVLVIEDALLDARFSDNPLVVGGPKIRFYAGAPLTASNGCREFVYSTSTAMTHAINGRSSSRLAKRTRNARQSEVFQFRWSMLRTWQHMVNVKRGFLR